MKNIKYIFLGIFVITSFFPRYAKPDFRYNGSDPSRLVWNLSVTPLDSIIIDIGNRSQSSVNRAEVNYPKLIVNPFFGLFFPIKIIIFYGIYRLIRFFLAK
jgi:hypothetical protein